jgi:RHS repeat-associated protein
MQASSSGPVDLLLPDQNGSVQDIFLENGNNPATLVDHVVFDPYGNKIVPDENASATAVAPVSLFGFQGMIQSLTTATFINGSSPVLYDNARYYSPIIGDFISVDPARAGTNYYEADGDDPITNEDPTGLMSGTDFVGNSFASGLNDDYQQTLSELSGTGLGSDLQNPAPSGGQLQPSGGFRGPLTDSDGNPIVLTQVAPSATEKAEEDEYIQQTFGSSFPTAPASSESDIPYQNYGGPSIEPLSAEQITQNSVISAFMEDQFYGNANYVEQDTLNTQMALQRGGLLGGIGEAVNIRGPGLAMGLVAGGLATPDEFEVGTESDSLGAE